MTSATLRRLAVAHAQQVADALFDLSLSFDRLPRDVEAVGDAFYDGQASGPLSDADALVLWNHASLVATDERQREDVRETASLLADLCSLKVGSQGGWVGRWVA